jgi:hypothetical protein
MFKSVNPLLLLLQKANLIEHKLYTICHWILIRYFITNWTICALVWLFKEEFENVTEYLHVYVIDDHLYVQFVSATIQSILRSWLFTGFLARITWQVYTIRAGTAYYYIAPDFNSGFIDDFSWVMVTQSFVFCVVFCGPWWLWSFFMWPFYCLSLFDLQGEGYKIIFYVLN